MPLSWTEGYPPSTHLNAYCLLDDGAHGLISSGPLQIVKRAIVNHFVERHPDLNLVVQDEAFRIDVAPLRCDLCNAVAEMPHWTYQVVPEQVAGDADGLWLICDTCHGLVQSNDYEGFLARWFASAEKQSPGRYWSSDSGVRVAVTAHYELMRTATFTRDEVAP